MEKYLTGLAIFKRLVYLIYFINTIILTINYYQHSNTINSYTLILIIGFYSQIIIGIVLIISFALFYKTIGIIEDVSIFTYLCIINLLNIIIAITNNPLPNKKNDFNVYFIPFSVCTAVTAIASIITTVCYVITDKPDEFDVSSLSSVSGTVSENSV